MVLSALLCRDGIPSFAFREDLVNGIPGAGRNGIWEDLEGRNGKKKLFNYAVNNKNENIKF